MAHLRAVPDPDDDPVVEEVVDPAAAVAPETGGPEVGGPEAPTEPSDEEQPRRYPSTIGGAFYLSILAVATTAIVIAARSDWRLGIQMLGGSLLVAALLRLLLNTRDAGMLAVRNRLLDTLLLGSTGTALIVLASAIPIQPPS